MNQNQSDPWRGPGGSAAGESHSQGRPFGGFGPNGPSQPGGVLPPPSSSYPHHLSQQPSGNHSLSIADLTQGPPTQHQYNTQPPPSNQSHAMSNLSNPLPHQSPQYLNRDRDMRDMRVREQEMRDREIRDRDMRERSHLEAQRAHQEEMMMRERDARERERERLDRLARDQQQQQSGPVQSHAGSIPIHQPVASKVPNSIHGPNGLLGNGAGGGSQQNGPSQVPQGGLFGLPLQHDQRQPSFNQQQNASAQQSAQSFLAGPSPMPGQAQLAHGQQPILNDALSYLDQVKVRFSDQPDVYNRFLDIMKDFKSQAIDTPGVISRVAELFNGHPALVQGFNTFLPPGYRIECGTDDNPDAIRVTTPSGTMTQSLQTRGRPFEPGLQPLVPANLPRQDTIESGGRWGPQQISPGVRPAQLPGYDRSGQTAQERIEQDNANAIHQQEQRNVSQLQNAVTAATNGQTRPALATSPGPGQQGMYPQQGGLFGNSAEIKRGGGPVEFNHAISYVNKIKNRFAQQPEIYKQFLEILQTYQRESKPIQDVYSQVTQLFMSAPDLLEDFKQFLPETAAHAKAQATARAQAAEEAISNVRGEPDYGTQVPQAQTPRPSAKMPPMGQFDPPSTSKDHKKRRTQPGPGAPTQSHLPPPIDVSSNRNVAAHVTNANKRQKLNNQQRPVEQPSVAVSPTLIPALPEPLPPAPAASTTQEELGFFDRAKKQISNRASYAEFLKLINLFTQDLIDKYTLADRVQSFIGSNPDLMSYFRNFLGIEDHDEVVEARARPDPGRVNLSHCRGIGPSYRHLPKRDQDKTCKGRDGMCYEVLNDVWASHPTWASEDSGFVAHRKNQYEEALHRIEEERHDYDFHIESCQRTIQLMEPIVQQIGVMNEKDRAAFKVERGLGGASEAIPKRIILKVYGREIGNRVLEDMYEKPAPVLPIVLQRLKQKLEEWKQVQREWEKVWRDQINKQFWKSLDHQGINTKNIDKKNFQQKTLTSEIQAKYEERKRSRDAGVRTKKHQLQYEFKEQNVLSDATQLILAGLESEKSSFNGGEQERIKNWLQDFVIKFFGLEKDRFIDRVEAALQLAVPVDDSEEHPDHDVAPITNRFKSHHKGGDSLRRAALERRNLKEDSLAPTSKESTPAPDALSEVDFDMDASTSETADQNSKKWIDMKYSDASARQMAMDETYEHTTFNLYANANIYCFFRLFEMLYTRLVGIKKNERSVEEAVRRWKGDGIRQKAALSLHMIDRTPDEFFKDVSGRRDYYSQVLEMCDEVLLGRTELAHLEETLRRYYNKNGWQLYTIDKLVGAILRFIMNILGGDAKDKSVDITNLFFRDRERPDTTRKQEIQYRKQVEKLSKDGEVYRISYTPADQVCTVRLFPSDDATFDNDQLTEEARWQYYVASYTMMDATEGVDKTRTRPPYLRRSIAPQNADAEVAYAETYGNLEHHDDQTAFIDLETYKLHLSNSFIFGRKSLPSRKEYSFGRIEESEPFTEKFVRNVAWMKDQRAEDVEARKTAWDKALKESLYPFGEQYGG